MEILKMTKSSLLGDTEYFKNYGNSVHNNWNFRDEKKIKNRKIIEKLLFDSEMMRNSPAKINEMENTHSFS